MSVHRTRAPTFGVSRMSRLLVVDNSKEGKQSHETGKPPKIIHVCTQGFRKKHHPKAKLGDKVVVALDGNVMKGFVVGVNQHAQIRKHGIASTDTNNVILLDSEGNPSGTRILAPIPSCLLEKRGHAQFAKVVAIAKKYV